MNVIPPTAENKDESEDNSTSSKISSAIYLSPSSSVKHKNNPELPISTDSIKRVELEVHNNHDIVTTNITTITIQPPSSSSSNHKRGCDDNEHTDKLIDERKDRNIVKEDKDNITDHSTNGVDDEAIVYRKEKEEKSDNTLSQAKKEKDSILQQRLSASVSSSQTKSTLPSATDSDTATFCVDNRSNIKINTATVSNHQLLNVTDGDYSEIIGDVEEDRKGVVKKEHDLPTTITQQEPKEEQINTGGKSDTTSEANLSEDFSLRQHFLAGKEKEMLKNGKLCTNKDCISKEGNPVLIDTDKNDKKDSVVKNELNMKMNVCETRIQSDNMVIAKDLLESSNGEEKLDRNDKSNETVVSPEHVHSLDLKRNLQVDLDSMSKEMKMNTKNSVDSHSLLQGDLDIHGLYQKANTVNGEITPPEKTTEQSICKSLRKGPVEITDTVTSLEKSKTDKLCVITIKTNQTNSSLQDTSSLDTFSNNIALDNQGKVCVEVSNITSTVVKNSETIGSESGRKGIKNNESRLANELQMERKNSQGIILKQSDIVAVNQAPESIIRKDMNNESASRTLVKPLLDIPAIIEKEFNNKDSIIRGVTLDNAGDRILLADSLRGESSLQNQLISKIDITDKEECYNKDDNALAHVQEKIDAEVGENNDYTEHVPEPLRLKLEEGISVKNSNSEGRTLLSVFPELKLRKRRKKGLARHKAKKRQKFINISHLPKCDTTNQKESEKYSLVSQSTFAVIMEDEKRLESEMDSTEYFSEMHVEEDPIHTRYRETTREKHVESELLKLEVKEQKVINELLAFLNEKVEDQKRTFRKQADDMHKKMELKYESQRVKLKEKLKFTFEQENDKLLQGIKWLSVKKENDLEANRKKYSSTHWHSQSSEIQQIGKMEAREIESAYIRSKAKLQEKGKKIIKENEIYLKAQKLSLDTNHQKGKEDIDRTLEKLCSDCLQQQQQQRSSYLRWHTETVKKKKDEIEKMRHDGNDDPSVASVIPVDSDLSLQLEDQGIENKYTGERKSAIIRDKRRKAVYMKGFSTRLSVEIHNEGVLVSYGKSSNGGSVGVTDFIPNGLNARRLINSIVSGEIPSHHIFNGICGFGSDKVQDCLLRAIVTDMRVNNETANMQRVKSFQEARYKCTDSKKIAKMEMELSELKKKYEKAIQIESICDLSGRKSAQQLERTKQKLSVSLKATHIKLAQADMKKAAKQEMMVKKKLVDARRHVIQTKKKYEVGLKVISDMRSKDEHSVDESSTNLSQVPSIIGILTEIFAKRRKTSQSSLLGSNDKSKHEITIQNKQRRPVSIVLRPRRSRILDEIKLMAASNLRQGHNDNDAMLELEQLLLLSLHPWSSPQLASSPPSSSSFSEWAEPGWMVVLEVPSEESTEGSILPIIGRRDQMIRLNSAECNSSEGRQAASLLSTRHFRSLVGDSIPDIQREIKSAESHTNTIKGLKQDDFLSISQEKTNRNHEAQPPSVTPPQPQQVSSKRGAEEIFSYVDNSGGYYSKRKRSSKPALDSLKPRTKLKGTSVKKATTKDNAAQSSKRKVYVGKTDKGPTQIKGQPNEKSINSLQNIQLRNVINSHAQQYHPSTLQRFKQPHQLAQIPYIQHQQAQQFSQPQSSQNHAQLLQHMQYMPRPGQQSYTSTHSPAQNSFHNPSISIPKDTNHAYPSPLSRRSTSANYAVENEGKTDDFLSYLKDDSNLFR